VTTLAASVGVWALRVHEVRGTADALRVVSRWQGRSLGSRHPTGRVEAE
jgi:dihydropteroate synthase